jgi:hypothetical protein
MCKAQLKTNKELVIHILEEHQTEINHGLWENLAEELGQKRLGAKQEALPEIEIVLWNIKASQDKRLDINIGKIIDKEVKKTIANCIVFQTDKVKSIIVWYLKVGLMSSEKIFWKYQSMVASLISHLYPNTQITLQQYKLGMELGLFSFPSFFRDWPEYIRLRSKEIGSTKNM